MLQVATVKSGEVWTSGRSGSAYFDLDLGDGGYVAVRLDPDGRWVVDDREVADGNLRDFLTELARARGTRDGVAKMDYAINQFKRNGYSHSQEHTDGSSDRPAARESAVKRDETPPAGGVAAPV